MAVFPHKVALIVYRRRQQLHLDSTLIDSTASASNETDRPFKGFNVLRPEMMIKGWSESRLKYILNLLSGLSGTS